MSAPKNRLETLQEYSIPLIAGVVIALVWANTGYDSYHALVHTPLFAGLNMHFIVNDLFMALFFGIAVKEIVEALKPGGELSPPTKALGPLAGTLGGVLGPIAVYLAWVAFSGSAGDGLARGWGIPTATDIALSWLVARLIFGKGHPAVTFLLLLAIADDAIGLAILAIAYPDPVHPVEPIWLAMVGGAMLAAYGMRRGGIKRWWLYLAIPGVASWFGLHEAHLHPALALVPIIPFIPSAAKDDGLFAADHAHIHHDPLHEMEHALKAPVDFGLFFFGLANAGVVFSSMGVATWAILAGLLIGKPLGVVGFASLAQRFGVKMPAGIGFRELVVIGSCSALGLTVALFVSEVAFIDAGAQGAAKMGALFSVAAAPMALAVAWALKVGRFANTPPLSKTIRAAIPSVSLDDIMGPANPEARTGPATVA